MSAALIKPVPRTVPEYAEHLGRGADAGAAGEVAMGDAGEDVEPLGAARHGLGDELAGQRRQHHAEPRDALGEGEVGAGVLHVGRPFSVMASGNSNVISGEMID